MKRARLWLWGEQVRVLLFPRRCPFCGRVLGFLTRCPDCEPELKTLKLMIPRLPDSEHCMEHLSGAAAVYRYDGCVRDAILRMKNGGQGYCAKELGIWMAAVIFGCTFRQQRGIIRLEEEQVLRRFDLVVPVPAGDRGRGYNLPELLARQLAWALDAPLEPYALKKTRRTEKQEGKTSRQRMENVKNAYQATGPACVEGKRVLLVDDVITTGATLSNCAKALRAAGALDVFAVTLAETQSAR
ncbi:ComF family protein [Fournierella sp.]|uniref:ComF family protein n=1 Tax=Allofournierella sp. TaxID=1940256 RepID=UPI0025BC3971|nr:phosphoribosyltransferase family protein [Fournierella sp.]